MSNLWDAFVAHADADAAAPALVFNDGVTSFGELKSPAERADAVLAARAAGFGAVKIRIDRADVAAGLAAVRAVRAAAGDGIEIMVDLNQWWRMPGDISPPLDAAAAS